MARRLEASKLVVASHNPGKVREILELLKPFGLDVISARSLNLPEPEETEKTFAGNAKLKALSAAKGSGFPALADDSGLVVPALGGDPGIYSARWAGPTKDFQIAMKKVIDELDDKSREAHFFCALAIAWPDDHIEVFEGEVHGTLTWPMRGTQGFGYDPIFVPDGFDITFGEMEPSKKHGMSHRANAFQKFITACLER